MLKKLLQKRSFAQYHQDLIVDFIFFNNTKNGFFFDIGAYDGVQFSNSYLFEKYRNWKGVCVEPNKTVFDKLQQNRSCIAINGVVSDVAGEVSYMKVAGAGEMLSGIVTNFNEKHLDRINDTISAKGGNATVETVQSYRIGDIIDTYNIQHISLLSIDTEGSELDILKTFPFQKVKPRLILVENTYKKDAFRNLLTAQGYSFFFKRGDEIYYHGSITNWHKTKLWLYRLLRKINWL